MASHKKRAPLNPETCDIHKFLKKHPFLSELVRKDGIIFECDGEAPSPSKDYGQLQINKDKVEEN